MPIRITGMNSGMDTESIISELVKAQKTKVDSVKKKQTSLQWKQDAWKELNSKIYKLYNGTLANMRFSADYSKKTTDISNSAIASVIAGDSAMNSTQELIVSKLATSGYLTGAEMTGDVTKNTKLTDMGITAGSSITVTTGGKSTDIKITSDTTVKDFVAQLQNAGVEANFDEKNKRLHIAAKKSGKENDFAITASNEGGKTALKQLGIFVYDEAAEAEYKKYATMDAVAKQAAVDADVEKLKQAYISQRDGLTKTKKTQTDTLNEDKKALKAEFGIDVENYEKDQEALAKTDAALTDIKNYVTEAGEATDALKTQVNEAWTYKIAQAIAIYNGGHADAEVSGAHKNVVQDAKITLNGVTYTGTSNTFEINGLTITALQESTEKVTLTTRQDTDGIYDMIKNFMKEYNALINEMDKLYNSESTKGYEPLTDEEKDEMSDSEVEKWEKKIQDSILRRDSNLSTISSAMKNIMLQGATVNGERMYLSSFGIETLGYFSAEENEKNAYHINGDEDDSVVSSKENSLKTAIASDPDTVIAFFSELSNNLYKQLSSLSTSLEGVRSFGSFYDDKKMKDDYNTYTTKIKDQEEKLTAMEERWYNKFSAMETALAKMQSNQSAVSSLLGG